MNKLTLSNMTQIAQEVQENYGKTELVEIMAEYELNEITIDDLGAIESVYNKEVRNKIREALCEEVEEEESAIYLELPATLKPIMHAFGKKLGAEIMYAMINAEADEINEKNLERILYGLEDSNAQAALARATETDQILVNTGEERYLKIYNDPQMKVIGIRTTDEEYIKHHGYLDTGQQSIEFKTLDSKINTVVFANKKIALNDRIDYENIIADMIERLDTATAETILPVEKEEEVIQQEEIEEAEVKTDEYETKGKFTNDGYESYEDDVEVTEVDQGGEEEVEELTHDGYPAVIVGEERFKLLKSNNLLIDNDYHQDDQGRYVVVEEVLLYVNKEAEKLQAATK